MAPAVILGADGSGTRASTSSPATTVVGIPVGIAPYLSAWDPANAYVYVPNSGSATVSVLSGSTAVATVPVAAGPTYAVSDDRTGEVYVADVAADAVSVLDGTTVVATVSVGSSPGEPAYDPADGDVYVPNSGSGNVSVLAGSVLVKTLAAQKGPSFALYDPSTWEIYVLNAVSGSVTILNGTSVIGTVGVGSGPSAAAFDAEDGDVYVANTASNNLSVLHGRSVAKTLTVGSDPIWVAYDNYSERIFVVNENSNTVSVLNGTAVVGRIVAGSSPNFVAYDSRDGNLYIPNQGTDTVSVANGSDDALQGTIAVGDVPQTAVVDPASADIYVTDADSDEVSLLVLPTYPVRFQETGLAGSIPWNVSIAGERVVGSGPVLSVDLTNGSYGFALGGPSGYAGSPATGAFPVDGAGVMISFEFTELFPVTFRESGLPSGSNWTVTIGPSSTTSDESSIVLPEANGSYSFTTNASGFLPTPSGGTIGISGAAPPVETVSFTPIPLTTYPVVFEEHGLPLGSTWSVMLGLTATRGNATNITIPVANGSYGYSASGPAGYVVSTPLPGYAEIVVNGSGLTIVVDFFGNPPAVYPVTFVEDGLPDGANWSVSLSDANGTVGTDGLSIVYSAPNGTWGYGVTEVPGFSPNPDAGTVWVHGFGVTVTIDFTPTAIHATKAEGIASIPLGVWLATGGAVVAVALLLGSVAVGRRRPPPRAGVEAGPVEPAS